MPPAKELHYLGSTAPKMENSKRLYRHYQKKPEKLEERLPNSQALDARDIDFFEQALNVSGQEMSFERYRSLFRSKGDSLSGDITPGYSALPGEKISAIGKALPAVRAVLLVRDPVARMWSHISMLSRIGRFKAGKLKKPEKFRAYLEKPRAMIQMSFATRVARNWAEHAPQIPFRYFFFDDIIGQPDKVRREVLQYLGADPDKENGRIPADFNRKFSKEKLELPDAIRVQLIDYLREELRESAALFGGRAKAWPVFYGV